MDFKLGLGCWALGSDSYGELSEPEASKILGPAYENGVRFFDTSPTYGKGLSEERIGKFLSNKKDILIASKVGMLPHSGLKIPYNFTKHNIELSIDNSLRRLKIDTIYLIQLHSPVPDFELEFPEIFETMSRTIRSGKVQNFGISLRSPSLFEAQSELFNWKSYQYNLSILDQRIGNFLKDGSPKLKPQLHFIARTPLNFGFLTDSPPTYSKLSNKHHLREWSPEQFTEWGNRASDVRKLLLSHGVDLLAAALRFPIDSELASIVIPGATTEKELMRNLKAFNSNKLKKDVVSDLKAFFLKNENKSISSPYSYEKLS
jgi:aryl-alcohol dehydrogenase-like predicted oxidoreductase